MVDKLVKAAQTTTDRYQTALANLKISEVENQVADQIATSEKNVALLDAKTRVVMPAPIKHDQNDKQGMASNVHDNQLPQTDEKQSQAGIFVGLAAVLTLFGFARLKRRKRLN